MFEGENRKLYLDAMEEVTGTAGDLNLAGWLYKLREAITKMVSDKTGLDIKRVFGDVELSLYKMFSLRVLLPDQVTTWPAPTSADDITPYLCHAKNPFHSRRDEPFFRWLFATTSRVMQDVYDATPSYPRCSAVSVDTVLHAALAHCHLAIKRVAAHWNPGDARECTDIMLAAFRDYDSTWEYIPDAELGARRVIMMVFEYIAVDPATVFPEIQRMAEWEDFDELFEMTKGFLSWDTYSLPDVSLEPRSHFQQCFNTICNADLREPAGRQNFNKFKFSSFNGRSEEDFKAGIVFLHVDKVCM